MIFQLPLAGLAIAGSAFLAKSNSKYSQGEKRKISKPQTRQMKKYKFSVPSTVQDMINGFTSSISRIIKPPPTEDFNAVVRDFMPDNALLLATQYPVYAGKIQFADLDGDLKNELITTYKLNNKITTLVLKKQNERWNKVFEITNSNHNVLNFIAFSDITGEGKKQLLLGYRTKGNPGELHGYSLKSGKAVELFTKTYDIIELLESPKTPKTRLAIWNKKETAAYDIEVMHWNGTSLEPVNNQVNYYQRKVLPYYGQKVRQMPQNPSNWYYLADTLAKSGMYRDGLMAIEYGMRLNPVSPSKEEFMSLKKEIISKLK